MLFLQGLYMGMPSLWAMTGAALAALLFYLCLLVVAYRRGRLVAWLRSAGSSEQWSLLRAVCPPRAILDWIGVAILAIPPLAMIAVISSGRVLMLRAGLAGEAMRQQLMAEGISRQLHALALGPPGCLLVWVVAALALGLAFGHRGRAVGLARAGALAAADPVASRAWLAHPGLHPWTLVALNLSALFAVAPLTCGLLGYDLGLIHTFGALGGLDPARRVEVLQTGLQEATPIPGASLLVAGAGLALAFLVSALILLFADPGRRRRALAPQLHEERSWARTVAAPAALLGTACALLVVVRSHREENLTPFPPGASSPLRLPSVAVDPPHLRGPERPQQGPQQGPVVVASLRGIWLDDEECASAEALAALLKKHATRLKKIERITEGSLSFTGAWMLLADRALPMSSLEPVLRGALDAGFPLAALLFVERSHSRRPILGVIETTTMMAATLRLSRSMGDVGGIHSDRFSTYESLAGEVVARRSRGQEAVLQLVASPRSE